MSTHKEFSSAVLDYKQLVGQEPVNADAVIRNLNSCELFGLEAIKTKELTIIEMAQQIGTLFAQALITKVEPPFTVEQESYLKKQQLLYETLVPTETDTDNTSSAKLSSQDTKGAKA